MGAANDEFLEKYNRLDAVCRKKYGMYRNADGTRDMRSAVRRFAEDLPPSDGEILLDIVSLRNLIVHAGAAEASDKILADLGRILAIAEGEEAASGQLSPKAAREEEDVLAREVRRISEKDPSKAGVAKGIAEQYGRLLAAAGSDAERKLLTERALRELKILDGLA